MGSNAYRCSHHPPTPELLKACDELGMLVIDETRLMGINDYHLNDLKRMMERDRNHPSIFCWSVGNEEWNIEGNIVGERVTNVMQDFAKSIDPTRPVTVGISSGFKSGISSVVEIMGYIILKINPEWELKKVLLLQHAVFILQMTLNITKVLMTANRVLLFTVLKKAGSFMLKDRIWPECLFGQVLIIAVNQLRMAGLR
jgi:hypothetical protein